MKDYAETWRPVFIIGAPRSGTNMLRDLLCSVDDVDTWDCDEINYIWLHGNLGLEHDRFSDDLVTPKKKYFIRRQFQKLFNKTKSAIIVEKTCANCLRVDYIAAIFPEAKFIYLERDYIDVVSSAKKKWTASLDIHYIYKKLRYVPVSDLYFHAVRYISRRVSTLFTRDKSVQVWGPRYPGMDEDRKQCSLLQLCYRQWYNCQYFAKRDLMKISKSQVYYLTYEKFISNPKTELRNVFYFMDLLVSEESLSYAATLVDPSSVQKGLRLLNHKELIQLEEQRVSYVLE